LRRAGFAGRTVLITGASSGIGAALAREFAAQGAGVVLAARRLERLEALAAEIRSAGGQALACSCDITRAGDPERVLDQVHAAGLSVDIVVANAGFAVAGRFEKLTLADYQRQFATNVFGVLRTIQAALGDVRAGRGSVVILGSVAGHISLPGISAYSMSKFAVRALAHALRGELRPYGVSVTLISPGFVASEFRQIDNAGRWHANAPETVPSWLLVSAERAARTVVRAVHRRQRERVVTGYGRCLVWIYRHAPWLVDAAVRLGRPVRRVVR
jgi:short-subunit dehydrogenase